MSTPRILGLTVVIAALLSHPHGADAEDPTSADHKSTVEAGNLDKAGPGGYVGLNCTWKNDHDDVLESDIRLNTTDYNFTYSRGLRPSRAGR